MWKSPGLAFHIMKLVTHCKSKNIICSLVFSLKFVCIQDVLKKCKMEKRKSIVIDAKIFMFLQNEGWSRVNSQEFTEPWLQYCRVCNSTGEQRWCQHGQGEESLTFLASQKVSDTLQGEVGAVQCLSCVSVWEWQPALPAALSWENPDRVCIHCSCVHAMGMSLQLLLPIPQSHLPLCATSVLLGWDCPLVWGLRNHQGPGQKVLKGVQLLRGVGMT